MQRGLVANFRSRYPQGYPLKYGSLESQARATAGSCNSGLVQQRARATTGSCNNGR